MDLDNLLVDGKTLAAVATAVNGKINTVDTKATNAAAAAAAADTKAVNAAQAAATADGKAVNAAAAAATADTKAANAASAAAAADTKAANAATAAANAASAAATAQATANARQAQLYLHNISIVDSDSDGTIDIKVLLETSTPITQASQITQAILNKILTIAYNMDGLNEWLIKLDTITKSTNGINIAGTFISNSGIEQNESGVSLPDSTITDKVIKL
jgi:hypothetical protein